MKQANIFLLLVILLVACSPEGKIESTSVPIITPIETQTLTPSPTSTHISTSTITFTPTATLEPSEITFDIDEGVPQEDVQTIQIGLERIRMYLRDYAGGDISPDIRKNIVVKIAARGENRNSAFDERGITLWFDVKGIEWARVGQYRTPFKSLEDEHLKVVPHEYVHGWQSSLGCLGYHYNLLGYWMSEGIAEYIAQQTIFQRNLVDKKTIMDFMLVSANATGESSFTLQALEDTQSPVEWSGHIGYLAIDYLMNISHADPVALRNICEQAGDGVPVNTAFKNAFGISRQDFYEEFEKYIHGIYMQTPQPSSDTGIGGKIVWSSSYSGEDLSKYMLNFCPIGGGECFGATKIKNNGSFFQSMFTGDYFISLNNIQKTSAGGDAMGWYSSSGMVTETTCGSTVHVNDHEITNITFKVALPIPCNTLTPDNTPTPLPKTGINGKVIWDASYPNQGMDKYMLNFCPITGGNCRGATPIQPDGTYIQSLPPGYYWISLNFKEGQNQPLGWYSSKGMVKENNCSALVQVVDNKITNVDFKVNSPILCR